MTERHPTDTFSNAGKMDARTTAAASAAATTTPLSSHDHPVLKVAPLSEKDGEVFSLDFNAHKHWYCPRPCVQLSAPSVAPVVERVSGFDMDGTYAMLNVLSEHECEQIIRLTEQAGYKQTCIAGIAAQDDGLRGPDKVVWCADQHLVDAIFERCRSLLPAEVVPSRDATPLALRGLSPRFRCLRYKKGQHQLGPHRDRGLYVRLLAVGCEVFVVLCCAGCTLHSEA